MSVNPSCPLCDHEFERAGALRRHLEVNHRKSELSRHVLAAASDERGDIGDTDPSDPGRTPSADDSRSRESADREAVTDERRSEPPAPSA